MNVSHVDDFSYTSRLLSVPCTIEEPFLPGPPQVADDQEPRQSLPAVVKAVHRLHGGYRGSPFVSPSKPDLWQSLSRDLGSWERAVSVQLVLSNGVFSPSVVPKGYSQFQAELIYMPTLPSRSLLSSSGGS